MGFPEALLLESFRTPICIVIVFLSTDCGLQFIKKALYDEERNGAGEMAQG